MKEVAKQLKKFIEVRVVPRSGFAQRIDHLSRQCEPPPSILTTPTTKWGQEVSNCVISTSRHWNKCRVVRGSLVSSTWSCDLAPLHPRILSPYSCFPYTTQNHEIRSSMCEYSRVRIEFPLPSTFWMVCVTPREESPGQELRTMAFEDGGEAQIFGQGSSSIFLAPVRVATASQS